MLSLSRPSGILLLDLPKYRNDTKKVVLSSGELDLGGPGGFLEGTRNDMPVLNLSRPGSDKTLFECAPPKVVAFGR